MKELDVFLELKRIQSELNHMFEMVFGNLTQEEFFYPSLNVQATQDVIRCICELPGVDPESIRVRFSMNTLIIEGYKKPPADDTRRPLRIEREYGQFYRSIPVPYAVDPLHASARFENGLLIIELPRIEDRRRRIIEIDISS